MEKILIVNGCGEVFIYTETNVVGSVNITELEERIGREPTTEDFASEFARLADEADADLANTIKLVWKAQELTVEDGFVQIGYWFQALRVDVNCLVYDDEPEKRRRIYELAGQIGAEVLILCKGTETDRSSQDGGNTWVDGPRHGMGFVEYAVSLTPEHNIDNIAECVAILSEQMADWNA